MSYKTKCANQVKLFRKYKLKNDVYLYFLSFINKVFNEPGHFIRLRHLISRFLETDSIIPRMID